MSQRKTNGAGTSIKGSADKNKAEAISPWKKMLMYEAAWLDKVSTRQAYK